MEDDFFNANGGGDPALIQHLIWYFGHPEVWLTLFLWLMLTMAIIKIIARLWQSRKVLSLAIFMGIVVAVLAVFLWLSLNAHSIYVEGKTVELSTLRFFKFLLTTLSVLSTIWIAIGFVRKRQKN